MEITRFSLTLVPYNPATMPFTQSWCHFPVQRPRPATDRHCTRIFLGGGIGYVAWEGTQHFPLQSACLRTPVGPAALSFNWRCQADERPLGAAATSKLRSFLMLGVGVPLPS